ncbi:MAG TPA: hypothetical protein VF008_00235 [Niastella sp.]
MKQLLTVMATVMCVCLAMGFTVTDNNTNDAKTGTNLRKQIAKWKNTTWVNPWLNEKRFNTQKKSLANNFIVLNNVSDPDVLLECSLTFPGGSFDLRPTGAFIYEIPTGQTVTFNGEVDGSNGNIIVVQLVDAYTAETLYFYNGGPSVVYQWTPELGKKYFMSVEYF